MSDENVAKGPSGRAQIRDRIIELRRVRAGDLKENPKNWRLHSERQRRVLRGMLQQIGYADAVLAREENGGLTIVDGHLRRSLDPDQILPVLVLDLNAEEADTLLAVLDPLAGLAEPDPERLASLLADIDTASVSVKELLAEVARGAGLPVVGRTDPDETPEAVPARSRPGDLWSLGERGHRVLCGDATNPADVKRLLDGDSPVLTVSDPPWGVRYDPAWRQRAADEGHLAYAARRIGPVGNDDRVDWREAWMLAPTDVVYCWHAGRHASAVQASLEAAGLEIRSQLIWAKPHFPISRGHYHWRHEPCWFAVRKGAQAHWVGGHKETTVWRIDLDPNVAGGHSTQKPVECMARPLRNHDAPSVYDPFVGSGTTVVAAEMFERRCYAMDIDPRWVDVTLARWEAFAGGFAVLVSREAGG